MRVDRSRPTRTPATHDARVLNGNLHGATSALATALHESESTDRLRLRALRRRGAPVVMWRDNGDGLAAQSSARGNLSGGRASRRASFFVRRRRRAVAGTLRAGAARRRGCASRAQAVVPFRNSVAFEGPGGTRRSSISRFPHFRQGPLCARANGRITARCREAVAGLDRVWDGSLLTDAWEERGTPVESAHPIHSIGAHFTLRGLGGVAIR
jgi:hypothetical protein